MKEPKKKSTGFMSFIQVFGEFIYEFFLIQLLVLLNTLRGGVILGFFPALGATYNYFFNVFIDHEIAKPVGKKFNQSWKKHFKKANQVGYSLLAIFAFLYVDLRINEQFIQSPTVHTLLLIVLFLSVFITTYTFTILVGHSLTYKAIFKQSFFVALSSPMYTFAAIIGLVLIYELMKFFSFLAVFFGAPLLVLPIAWFTFKGLEKIEEMQKDEDYQ